MSKEDKMVLWFAVIFAVVFFSLAGYVYRKRLNDDVQLSGQIIKYHSAFVIGQRKDFSGARNGDYTLIEFGDYECPPCRDVNKLLPSVMNDYKGKLRFVFRNYPLTTIHPFAMRAALTAEAAREQGKFWQTHDALYTETMCKTTLDSVVLEQNLDKKKMRSSFQDTAKKAVEQDVSAANIIGINSTPTFILCCPNDKVIRLKTLLDIKKFIR